MSARDHQPASAPWGPYGARNPSEAGSCCHLLTERVIGLADIRPGQEAFMAGHVKRPQQDSNLRSRLRRPMLYPLSYGGYATWERVPVK